MARRKTDIVLCNTTALTVLRFAGWTPTVSTIPAFCSKGPDFSACTLKMLKRTPTLPERTASREALLAVDEFMGSVVPWYEIRREGYLPFHIMLGRDSRGGDRKLAKPHLHKGDLPERSLIGIGYQFGVPKPYGSGESPRKRAPGREGELDVAVVRPELALIQAASRRDPISVLEMLWEACGTYQQTPAIPALDEPDGGDSCEYNVQPVTSRRSIENYLKRAVGIPGVSKVKRILRYVEDGSASPRETKLALLLGLPFMYGGYGLGIPEMNREVRSNDPASSLSGKGRFYLDLHWPGTNVDVEYQSTEMHSGELKRISDSKRANSLDSMGWHVIGITKEEMNRMASMDVIAETIRAAIKKRKDKVPQDHERRKINLRRSLGLPIY